MPIFPRSIWLSFAAIAGLLGLQAFVEDPAMFRAAPPPAAAAAAVDFVGSTPIELSRISADGAAATVLVRNDSEQDATATFEGTMLDRNGDELGTISHTQVLRASRATPVTLRLAPARAFDARRDVRLPARGVIVLSAKPVGATTGTATVKVRDVLVLQLQPSSAERLITLAGLGAALGVLLFGLAASGRAQVNPQIAGTPAWTPQSWSTNLAIGGALLTMVLAITALPAQTHFAARTAYSALSAFFAVLVALAPAVYGLLKVGGQPTPGSALRLFALAAAVTVWGTIGQLGMTALLFLELSAARVISGPSAMAAALLFAVVALLVWVYALRAVHAYMTAAPQPAPKTSGGPVPPPAAPVHWPLL